MPAFDLPADYRQAIEDGIANGRWQGLAIGVIDHGRRKNWFFGATAPGAPAPTADDVFELGSTTRAFTGLLLAKAAVAGKVRLDASLATIYGRARRFADPRLAAITLTQLATQRASLPPLPPNLFPRDLEQPYIGYDPNALAAFLDHGHLANASGEYAWSDLGVAVLGAALAQNYGMDYRALLAREVLAPLGMTESGFGPVPKLLDGYQGGQPVAHWDYQALAPAGGLRASLNDLLRLVAANLQPDESPLRDALLLARQPRVPVGGGDSALAWQTIPIGAEQWPLVWQAGLSTGFASFIGFRADQQRGVVVLANSGTDVSALGLALLSGQPAPPAPHALPTLAAATLAQYAGLYQFQSGDELIVRLSGDTLEGQLPGVLPQVLVAYDIDAFDLHGGDAQLTFQRDAGSGVTSVILHRGGVNLRAERLSDRAPALKRRTAALPAAQLAAYAGDYALSPDLLLRITPAGGGLRAQMSAHPAVALRCFAPDRFGDADGTIELGFHRDAHGKIDTAVWRQGSYAAQGPREDWGLPTK